MSRPPLPGEEDGNDEDRYTPRPGDEVVEPLFGALQPGAGQGVSPRGTGPRPADVRPNGARPNGTRPGQDRRAGTSRGHAGPPGLLSRLRGLLRGRPAAGERGWFTCPVCGAEVRRGASSCRECGSDDRTGWSEATAYDDLDLPEPEGPEIPDSFEEFTRVSSPRRGVSPRLLLSLLAAALLLLVARAVQLLFAA